MTLPIGGIWTVQVGQFVSTSHTSDAAGLAEAKLLDPVIIHLLPGTEGIPLGTFTNTQLLCIAGADGIFGFSRFHIFDGNDPTKRFYFDPQDIGSGETHFAVLPNWDGFLIVPALPGVAGQFLQSSGSFVQPVWADVVLTNSLLDGSSHTDTLVGTVVAGDLIYGNATPLWARLAKGTDGQILALSGGLPAWSSSASLLRHNTIAHIATFTVATCKLTNASAVVTTTASGFNEAKVGDRIYFSTPIFHTSIIGAKILTVDSDTQVTMDRTFTGGTTGFDQTATVVPYDHNGHLLLVGAGDPTDSHDGLQTIWGNLEWRKASTAPAGVSSATFLVEGGSIPNQPNGFGITTDFASQTAYFDASQLTTGAKIFRFPTLTVGSNGTSFAVCGNLNAAQTLDSTILSTANKIQMDGTAVYTVFQSAAAVDRLGFDLTPMSALRSVSWSDFAGRAYVQGAAVTFADGDATPSVVGSRLFKATNTGATNVTTFDAGAGALVGGEEITVIFTNANTTLLDVSTTGNLNLAGSADYNAPANTVMRFVWDGSTWWEMSRSND